MIALSEADQINRVLGVDFQYVVPLYQRRYVWENANWETLWKDILVQEDIDRNKRGTGHFTGPIVTRRIDDNRYEVIDGQQRLATLEIIFCVIRDLYDKHTEADDHIVNSINNHKIVLTKYDNLTYNKIVEGEYGEKIHDAFDETHNELQQEKIDTVTSKVFGNHTVSSNILKAYNYFYEAIRTHVQNDTNKAVDLFNTITSDFRLMHLSLSENEQAEKVFESINATGRMLSDFDYLRNNLFLRARKLGNNDYGELYRDIYYNDPDFWPFEMGWDAQVLQSFLQAFLMATWNPKCFKEENAKPFEEYLKYSKDLQTTYPVDIEKIPFEFKQLSEWAESYRLLQDEAVFIDFEHFRKDLDFPDLNSFLLYVKHQEPKTLSNVCRILEAYIVRRMLVLENAECNHAQINEESYHNIEEFFSDLVINNNIYSTESFVEFLNKNGSPNDIEVMTAFEQVESKNAAFIAYVFRRISTEEERVYGMSALNWGDQEDLSAVIQERLGDLTELNNVFSHLWPELYTIQ